MLNTLQKKSWENYETSQEWLREMQRRNEDKQVPQKTIEAMNLWFSGFLAFHKITPDELILEAKQNQRLAEDRLQQYWIYKKSQIDRNSCITGIYGVVKGFYTHNEIIFRRSITPSFSNTSASVDGLSLGFLVFLSSVYFIMSKQNPPRSVNRSCAI